MDRHSCALRQISRLVPLWIVLAALVAPPAVAAEERDWVSPVTGPVVRAFRPPTGHFGAGGHAGLDHRVPPGAAIRSAGAGTVAFVGGVAGVPFVVVAHGARVRTTYAPMRASVRPGDPVEPGTAIGTVDGPPLRGHETGHLHFGLLVDGQPRDPALLFAEVVPADVVNLVPSEGPIVPAREARALARWYGGGSTIPDWALEPAGPPLWKRAGGALVSGWGYVRDAAVRYGPAVLDVGGRVAVTAGLFALALPAVKNPLVAAEIAVRGQEVLWEAGRGVGDWWKRRRECTPPWAPAPPVAPDHRLVAVGGVNSETAADGSTFALSPSALGVDRDRVSWFSYAPDRGPYEASDTHIGAAAAADLLAADLRRFARAYPAVTVDLVGHSQGGVVVEAFLKRHFADDPSAYPPIGAVVTLAAPHRGSVLAGEVYGDRGDPALWLLGAAAARIDDRVPAPGSGAARDLVPGDGLVADLARRPLPSGIAVTTVGASGDVLVTGDTTRIAGAEQVMVAPSGWFDHAAILDDPEAMRAARLALAGAPPPCVALSRALRGRVQPALVRQILERPLFLTGAVRNGRSRSWSGGR